MILFLTKIFEKEAYADDFVSGQLYLKSVEYFVELEGDETGRADSHENIVGSFRPEDVSIQIGGVEIAGADLAAPIRYSSPALLNRYLLCMSAATNGPFEKLNSDTLPEFREHLQIPDDSLQMGDWAVLVTNVSEFHERLRAGAMKAEVSLKTGLVNYRKINELHGFIPDEDWLFTKDERFAWQREYRAVVNTRRNAEQPQDIRLDVGALSDICYKIPTEKLRELEISVQFPDEEE